MQRRSFLTLAAAAAYAQSSSKPYPMRWVYCSRALNRDEDVEDIRKIAETSRQHGLNGMALAVGVDNPRRSTGDYEKRLAEVRRICTDNKLEMIPLMFSIGYAGSILGYDRNLAEGLPVRDALFTAHGRELRFDPDPPLEFANGSFEEYEGNRAKSLNMQDEPGVVSFIDTSVVKDGKASLRLENFQQPHGHGRIMQEIAVHPYRQYRITCWVKTEGLEPKGAFRILALTKSGREIAPVEPEIPGTSDWRKVSILFNSMTFDRLRIYAGVWGGKAGKCWLDGLKIEEVGFENLLRRPGTPVTVRNEAQGTGYEEGRDYETNPILRLTQNSRIQDGERLRIDYYHWMSVNRGQVTACMCEPKVYEVMAEQAQRVHELLAPSKVLFSMDEIRAGGSCKACKDSGLTMAQILGRCITRQTEIVRKLNPKVEVFVWSDMLDPSHNAHGNYFLVDGDFTGSWNHIPKDLRIVCWYYQKRRESLEFFSKLGYQTVAGAYYDGDNLENPKGWLAAMENTPGASGIMYTTWQNKYELLAPFGDLLSGGHGL
jgi:hypothetical protein